MAATGALPSPSPQLLLLATPSPATGVDYGGNDPHISCLNFHSSPQDTPHPSAHGVPGNTEQQYLPRLEVQINSLKEEVSKL